MSKYFIPSLNFILLYFKIKKKKKSIVETHALFRVISRDLMRKANYLIKIYNKNNNKRYIFILAKPK